MTRYKAVLAEGAGYYYETLLDYVHLILCEPASRIGAKAKAFSITHGAA